MISISEYSSLKLFGGDLGTNGATFQVGADAGANNTTKVSESVFSSVSFDDLTGSSNFNLSSIAAGNEADADYDQVEFTDADGNPIEADDLADGENWFDAAIRSLDDAITDLTDRKSVIGSAGNRMDSALQTLTTQYENLSSAKSIITDADVAAEASKFVQNQILQQVSTSLLSQANQAPSIALSLV